MKEALRKLQSFIALRTTRMEDTDGIKGCIGFQYPITLSTYYR